MNSSRPKWATGDQVVINCPNHKWNGETFEVQQVLQNFDGWEYLVYNQDKGKSYIEEGNLKHPLSANQELLREFEEMLGTWNGDRDLGRYEPKTEETKPISKEIRPGVERKEFHKTCNIIKNQVNGEVFEVCKDCLVEVE